MVNFEAFLWSIKLSINLLFLNSNVFFNFVLFNFVLSDKWQSHTREKLICNFFYKSWMSEKLFHLYYHFVFLGLDWSRCTATKPGRMSRQKASWTGRLFGFFVDESHGKISWFVTKGFNNDSCFQINTIHQVRQKKTSKICEKPSWTWFCSTARTLYLIVSFSLKYAWRQSEANEC